MKMDTFKVLALALVMLISGSLFASSLALAQQKVDQGAPGTQGPWPVKIIGGLLPDGGSGSGNQPYQCAITSPNKTTLVDGGGTITVPTTAQPFRIYTNVCNSPLNPVGTIVSCRADGTAPDTVAATGVGDVLNRGDCVTYTVSSARTIQCVANIVAAAVNTYECF